MIPIVARGMCQDDFFLWAGDQFFQCLTYHDYIIDAIFMLLTSPLKS